MRRSWLRVFWLAVVLAGGVAGYLASTGLGTRLLHVEIETQLGRLLEGPVEIAEVDVRWVDGLRIEARDLHAFAGDAADAPEILTARRVLAWVDLLELLIGRLELSTLVLEGPQLRIVRRPDGSFVGLPVPASSAYPDEGLDDREGAERFFADLAGLDGVADRVADRFRPADRIEVADGTLTWTDHTRTDREGAPASLRLELLEGFADRDWLSDAIALEWRGVFIDGQHAPFPFEASIGRAEGKHFRWSLLLAELPIDWIRTPLAFLQAGKSITALSGALDLRLSLETHPEGRHVLGVEGDVRDASIRIEGAASPIVRKHVGFGAELDFDPHVVRLSSARLIGEQLDISLLGQIDRPIRDASTMGFDSRTRGLELDDVRELARSLEADSDTARTIARLTERVLSGRIRYVEAGGQATLARWRSLGSGRMSNLPQGFRLAGAFDSLSVVTGPADRLDEVAAEVEWIEDRLVFRNGRALFRDRPLPVLDLTLEGVSHLVRTVESEAAVTTNPPTLSGLPRLGELLRPRDPTLLPPVEKIALAIDTLEHPIFRWPLHDVRALVEPLRGGVEVTVREGVWGDASVSGEVAWFTGDAPTVSAALRLGPPPEEEAEPSQEEASPSQGEGPPSQAEVAALADEAPHPAARWASGELEMAFRPRPWLPFETLAGYFQLDGATLVGNELDVAVHQQGQLAARLALGLGDPEAVGFDVSFALTGGRLEDLSGFVRLPADLVTGRVGATGSMKGPIRSRKTFISELDGRVRVEAEEGLVYMKIPLMLRLAKATEGYNPFADEDRLAYETLAGTLSLDHGLLSSEDFELEGPLRVFATAEIDTNRRPAEIRAVVGIFLFRQPTGILENLPLVRSFLPGSERGLIGAYFDVLGPVSEPEVDALPLQTMMSAVPNAIKAPFRVLRLLFDRPEEES